MKQRINIDQLKELSLIQQNKLKDWWNEHQQQGDIFVCLENDFLSGKQFTWDGNNKPFNMSIPLLNVGQMFEMLLGCSCIDCTLRLLDERVRGKIYGMELCEALWILIKEYLGN